MIIRLKRTLVVATLLQICSRCGGQDSDRVQTVEGKEPIKYKEFQYFKNGMRHVDLIPDPDAPPPKYLWRGKEFDKPPALFDIGDGEKLLLPEVLPERDFGLHEFAAEDDHAGQWQLRQSRTWGRLYVEGWPASVQYMRADFGDPPPNKSLTIVVAEPLSGCRVTNADQMKGKLVIVERGVCTFGTKAIAIEEAGAAGLLIVNTEDGLRHPAMADHPELKMFAGMIPKDAGTSLLKALHMDSETGRKQKARLIPINCHRSGSSACDAATMEERKFVADRILGGHVRISDRAEEKFEFLQAEFGARHPTKDLIYTFADPPHGCGPLSPSVNHTHAAVVVLRGGCDFADKAGNVSASGAAAMLLSNHDDALFSMGVLRSEMWRVAGSPIFAVTIANSTGLAMREATRASGGTATVSFSLDADVTTAAWKEIENLPVSWPGSHAERLTLLDSLLNKNINSPERIARLQYIFKRDWGELIQSEREL